MNTVILITSSFFAVIGIGFSIWSIIDTRKRYYEEFMEKKRGAKD